MAKEGRILSCVGGLYTVASFGESYYCYAKGNFRAGHIKPVAGDRVEFEEAEGSAVTERKGAHGREEYGQIRKVLPRKNLLIRPPLANLDRLFLVIAAKDPEPNLLTADKLCAIACHNRIPLIVICSKSDLGKERAEEIAALYRAAGFDAISLSEEDKEACRNALTPYFLPGTVSAFAGASGVGKSTLINTLFPSLAAETGEVSRKTLRGRQTTRQSLLYDLKDELGFSESCFLADTPGFSLLDFQRFFFMEKEDLPFAFPEFEPYLNQCRYTKCSHTVEEGCRILEAVREGIIPLSRHESYKTLYAELKDQRSWEKRKDGENQ